MRGPARRMAAAHRAVRRRRVIVALAAWLPAWAPELHAQVSPNLSPGALPNAGSVLREQQQQIPPPPPAGIQLQIAPQRTPVPSGQPGGIRFAVSGFELSGNTVIATSTLLALVQDETGPARSLDDLDAAAARITAYYRAHGYLVAQAYVPPQEIANGVVRIAIAEGHYGEIRIVNQSRTRDAVLARFASAARLGDVLDEQRLERATLLMQDASGTTGAKAVVSSGAAPGTSDLAFEIPAAPPLAGSVQIDNYGESSTGTARLVGALQWNNPLGFGDRLTARALTSVTGQTYGDVDYTVPLGGSGLAWGVGYARSTYVVGGQFSSLDAHGSANVVSTFFAYPLLRTNVANVLVTLGVDHKILADDLGAFDTADDRTSDVAQLRLSGNLTSATSFSSFDVSGQQGNLRQRNATPQEVIAQTAGAFSKFVYAFTHTQALGGSTQLYLSVNGQQSSRNLDSAEQISLGGPFAVRAYATGVGAVDEGYVATLELRQSIRQSAVPVLITLIGFLDTGDGTWVVHPYAAGSNHVRLSGAGVGAWLNAPGNYSLKVSYAHTLGYVPSTAGAGHANRVWATLAKSF
ncbi:ShlB/FhaC/HecB family hemolysin secretion/activation protein [Paraburkholderia sp. HP33-1]|uniref:ShlB/FhaC/HecB family hemolysin secretion/activation protein n=1 Tax=Paraburkholderia sp. HP33-1 TaxID=2883243 RepID=UPI001F4699A8|nr:ShlB/FhaC/HecB family hemolysin secretion/activation protein [Paraburkholderia sp. HP33-1]